VRQGGRSGQCQRCFCLVRAIRLQQPCGTDACWLIAAEGVSRSGSRKVSLLVDSDSPISN
jgi:hypothetical protein